MQMGSSVTRYTLPDLLKADSQSQDTVTKCCLYDIYHSQQQLACLNDVSNVFTDFSLNEFIYIFI